MIQLYQIEGMSCGHCVQRVQKALSSHPYVMVVQVSQNPPLARLQMSHPVLIEELQLLLNGAGAYTLIGPD
jgi:copper chaperone CopZ